jgi:hypothetical protein
LKDLVPDLVQRGMVLSYSVLKVLEQGTALQYWVERSLAERNLVEGEYTVERHIPLLRSSARRGCCGSGGYYASGVRRRDSLHAHSG